MSRREFLAAAAGSALLLPRTPARAALPLASRGRSDSVVIQWNEALLQAVRESKLGPPMVARALAVAHSCMYDAWAAYDRVAVGTRFAGALRQSPAKRTLRNKRAAISFAAHRAAADLFPASTQGVFDPLMAQLGYDPSDMSSDTASAAGIGNLASQAVLDFRHRDGANQLGDEAGGSPGVPYSDYTGFVPANEPMDLRAAFDPGTVHDPNAWQPLRYEDLNRALVTPSFVGAHWLHVMPFALPSGDDLRSPTGPARYGTPAYEKQAAEIVDLSARLTDREKVIAEYWADGPRSELPPGHWNLFAQFVARRDRHGPKERGVDLDVKLFFALSNAVFDAGICAWDNKCSYASVRPITAVRYLFRGRTITAWAGPYRGRGEIDGPAWLPYQPSYFPTPPFPEYSSGHSNFSAAGAEILRRFTRSDIFGGEATITAGSSKVEPGTVPATDITLSWPTFSAAADEAGLSRRYGGIHFEQGDLDARRTGRLAARTAWAKALTYFNGTA
ncbi:MAG: vanadium-dependent haloperoxidase [Actinomycetota bacterium]|nr:vanadium-dependent haloperoxidase [Actinomycetota bacterium]